MIMPTRGGRTGSRWAAGAAVLFAGGVIAVEWALRRRHRRCERMAPAEGLRSETRDVDALVDAPGLRMVAFGDSITHGMHLPLEETYPYLLQEMLRARCSHAGRMVTVINAGAPGETSIQGLSRLERDVIAHVPAVTLIAFGANDAEIARRLQDRRREEENIAMGIWGARGRPHLDRALRARTRRLGEALKLRLPLNMDQAPAALPRTTALAYRWALREMAKRIRRATSGEVVFLTTAFAAPADPEDRWPTQSAIRRAYNDIVRHVAWSLHAPLLDIESLFSTAEGERWHERDGVHLSAVGQRRLAELAFDLIDQQLLPCRTRCDV